MEQFLFSNTSFFFSSIDNTNLNNINSTFNFFLFHTNFFNQNKLNINNLNTPLIIDLNDYKLNQKDELDLNKILYIKKPSFISFFINNLIDVPVCFKKSLSLNRKSFELPVLKFINFLMKKGEREKISKFFFHSLRIPEKKEIKEIFLFSELNNWISLYYFINSFFINKINNNNFFIDNEDLQITSGFNHFFQNNQKILNTDFFFKNNIQKKITQINPTFCYFIYSVDKNVRKFSRGKSGKYIFVWKYIASYKRNQIAMKWIAKEIRFNSDKQISKRILQTFEQLEKDVTNTFAWKSKVFSHNYVFKNFKKTLMETLKTTTQ